MTPDWVGGKEFLLQHSGLFGCTYGVECLESGGLFV
jgi:hypothetical protein